MSELFCIGGPRDGERLRCGSQQPCVKIMIDKREKPDYDVRELPLPVVPNFEVARYLPTRCYVGKGSMSGFRGRRFLFLRFEGMDKQKAVDEFAERRLGITPSPQRTRSNEELTIVAR